MVVVEVRQRTLCVEGRGWAGGRGGQREEEKEEDEEDEEDQATDIKSNNPHLAGGEKTIYIDIIVVKIFSMYILYVIIHIYTYIHIYII